MIERAKLNFYDLVLRPDPSRTVVRPFEPGYPREYANGKSRTQEVVDGIAALDEAELDRQLEGVTHSLDANHRDVDALLRRRFDEVKDHLQDGDRYDDRRRRLIGAYLSQEYAFEAAALFNPSVVPHPDQEGVDEGAVRIVLSLRGIGEGHVSSVTFRTGMWTPRGPLVIDPPSPTSVPPILDHADGDDASIRLQCGGSRTISETVLFPVLPSQRQGIEDMRLVRFVEDDGAATYHGTYTAWSGAETRSELLSGDDFHDFEMRAMTGPIAAAKGMALFPRRIGGRYAMLSRQDGKRVFLNYSDDLLRWEGESRVLIEPRYPWEFVQMGNCGSPIEIDEGWLVLTHGVGTVRNYCIGACLLDKDDPSKLLARTPRPVLAPAPKERDGYVPNVVYSCGGMVRDRVLLLPYAVADSFTSFAWAEVDDLLRAME
ncbi:glycoside hydrolase family 130 protein [Sphingomonas lenta]|uniref:Glycosidase n=1 Tax=Sphingomonas lenta TaxID=1141887 RepID=A0A2A2SBP6_9SPHN|nr:glycoside hydrolase family 130 protein [Sphingomonas lenta]PAX06724.1 glycosidase [Sphingomonas lenta]